MWRVMNERSTWAGQAVTQKRTITGDGVKVPIIVAAKTAFYPYFYVPTDMFPEPIFATSWRDDIERNTSTS
jgi:hypothetical protein